MKHICDICTAPMILKEHLGKTKTVKGTQQYRRRRFICSVPGCGYEKMVFGDGWKDEVAVPEEMLKEARKISKRRKRND